MNIRSLTIGSNLPPQREERASLISRLGEAALAGRATLEAAGFSVQTTRLSTQPLERWLEPSPQAADQVAEVGQACAQAGIDYFALGTIQAGERMLEGHVAALLEMLPDLLLAAPNAFGSVQVGIRHEEGSTVGLDSVRGCAHIIRRLSENTEEGFGNLRFAAAANCSAHVPFFPASYYIEDELNEAGPEFGLALEAADLAVLAFRDARTHEEARANLLGLLVEHGTKVAEACGGIVTAHALHFTGLDISMAPYPEQERSIGHALELLSGAPLGAPGTLSAAAFFTDILAEARRLLPTVGYSGLMLPLLEDSAIAARAAEGLVDLDTLLLLSAVCGLGLDTVPLPGDISEATLSRIILDMASLAVRLDKPLTARLMPVPGKSAGEPAEWLDFPYFARGRVLEVPSANYAEGLLGQGFVKYGS